MTDTITDDNDPNTDEPFGDEIVMLPGWPGYRTRPGRTGLDYLDTQYEVAHMSGLLLRKIVSNRMYMGKHGPNIFKILFVAFLLWTHFPVGSLYVCPVVILIALVGIILALRERFAQTSHEMEWDEDTDEDGAAVEDENIEE